MKLNAFASVETIATPLRVALDNFTITVHGNALSLEGQWVDVVSPENDIFKDAEITIKRDLLMGKKLSQMDIDRFIKASLIVGWSFEEPCDNVNKLIALQVWPKRLTDYIVKRAESIVDVNFTLPELTNSLNTPEKLGG